MKICIFGAGSSKIDDNFKKAGKELGNEIAIRSHELIFGGGEHGMMGAVVQGVLEKNGKVTGISPEFLHNPPKNYSEFIETKTLQKRKELLINLSDSFIITPGGLGTLDEFFEVLTLKKLKCHNKPIIILNIDNYFNEMINMLLEYVEKQFIDSENTKLYKITNNVNESLNYIEDYYKKK